MENENIDNVKGENLSDLQDIMSNDLCVFLFDIEEWVSAKIKLFATELNKELSKKTDLFYESFIEKHIGLTDYALDQTLRGMAISRPATEKEIEAMKRKRETKFKKASETEIDNFASGANKPGRIDLLTQS